MKIIKKSVLFIGIFIIVMSGVSYGAEIQHLKLSKAIQLALTQNLDLKIAELNMSNDKLSYQKIQANNIFSESNLMDLQAKIALAKAKNTYLQTRNQIVIELYQKYNQIINSQMDIQIKEKKLELENKILQTVNKGVERGHRGQLELLQQQNKYDNALFDLEKVNDNYQQFLWELKFYLGIEVESKLSLTTDIFPLSKWKITQQEVIEMAVEKNMILEVRKRNIELAELKFKRAKVVDTPKLDQKILKNNKKLAKLQYKMSINDLKSKVQKKFYLYRQATKKLNLSLHNLKQAEKNYEIIKKQERVGLKTKNDLLVAKINQLQADYNYKGAIVNYNLQKLQLKNLLGFEIGVSLDESK